MDNKVIMEAKDLRIGNSIQLYRKSEDPEKTIHQIKSIYYNDEFKEYFVELMDGFCVNVSKGIEPVRLTCKWLLNLGFEDTSIAATAIYYTKKGLSLNIDGDDDFVIAADFHNNKIINCKYVHQLQNLYFALTGDELIVK